MPKHGSLGSRALTGARDVIVIARSRRRLIVEGLVCALVAVFAAQPALAGGPPDNPGNGNGKANGHGTANGQGPPPNAGPPATLPAQAAPAAATAGPAAQADAPGKSGDSNGAAGTDDSSFKSGSSAPGNSGSAPGRASSAGAAKADASTNQPPVAGKSNGQTAKATPTAAPTPTATRSTTPAATPPATASSTPETPTGSSKTGSRTSGARGGTPTPATGTATGAGTLAGATGGAIAADAPATSTDQLGPRNLVSASEPEDKEYRGFSKFTHGLASAAAILPGWVWLSLLGLGLLVLLLSASTIVGAARTRRLKRQRAKLMEDVGLLQEALLPSVPPLLGGLATSVAYRPAAGLAAGGDFYDAFALPGGRIGLLLGDVSGHGRDALAKTSLVRFTVRAHLEAGMSPREAISISGRALDGRLGDDFATVVAAIHDPAAGTLTYASAGHPPPLVLGPSAHTPLTHSSAPPLGVGFPTGQRQTIVPMPEGTTIVMLSDGLLESRIDGDAIGPDRLSAWVAEMGCEATAAKLLDLVIQRADAVRDDLAAVVLHAAPGATAPAVAVEQLKLDVLDTHGPSLDGFLRAAGVAAAQRRATGRRVSERLADSGATLVEITTGNPPKVRVESLGTTQTDAPRERVRTS